MTSVREWSSRALVIVGILATLILAGLSLVAVGALGGGFTAGRPGSLLGACTVPNLSGTVVDVTLTNMGGPMMGGGNGPLSGGAMRLSADRTTVRRGTVSFLVTNGGGITHEMVVLPLPESQIVGTRPIGGDAKIDEAGSLGEASNTCGEGAGQGILPGASGWVSVTLEPGRYELLCNLPGHYAAGMYTQLTVTE
jgi:uncharacterized cupredoxin-like copper-binding protein